MNTRHTHGTESANYSFGIWLRKVATWWFRLASCYWGYLGVMPLLAHYLALSDFYSNGEFAGEATGIAFGKWVLYCVIPCSVVYGLGSLMARSKPPLQSVEATTNLSESDSKRRE
jgi:hypothetical protein